MIEIKVSSNYFNIKDTLECGQVFRFLGKENGFYVFSSDRCAFVYQNSEETVIKTLARDKDYFYNYFDLERDYSAIVNSAVKTQLPILIKSSNLGKGIRILNQNSTEALFSFVVSQNNNIPRIKGIIEKLCVNLGEKHVFDGMEYYSFPTVKSLANASLEVYKSIGLGYRAEYIKNLAQELYSGLDLQSFNNLTTKQLKQQLINLRGVGPKVADCVSLFGFHRSDSFPVDTWIEKVYKQDLDGKLSDRNKIANELVERFGDNSGYFQQYLFYYKRSLENKQ